jgi:hypothetical protein
MYTSEPDGSSMPLRTQKWGTISWKDDTEEERGGGGREKDRKYYKNNIKYN